MEDFIIRLYRFKKDNPRALVGLVEKVGEKGKIGFTTMDELWEILNSSMGEEPQGKGGFKRKRRRFFDRVTNHKKERRKGTLL